MFFSVSVIVRNTSGYEYFASLHIESTKTSTETQQKVWSTCSQKSVAIKQNRCCILSNYIIRHLFATWALGCWSTNRWTHRSCICLGHNNQGRIFARTIYLYVWKCAASICAYTTSFRAGTRTRESSVRHPHQRDEEGSKEFALCVPVVNTNVASLFLLAGIRNNVLSIWTSKDMEYCIKFFVVV